MNRTYVSGVGAALPALKKSSKALDTELGKAGWSKDDVDLVVPHQASFGALAHLSKRCAFTPDKIINVKFWRAIAGGARCGLVEAAENFLDPTHTVFVHKQLFYSVKNKTPTRVVGHGNDTMAEINYYGKGDAGGLIGKVMGEKERSKSVGRFIAPNIAEVEFHGPKGVNFITTGFITPAQDNSVEGYGIIGLPGPIWWAWLKYIFLYPWIKLVYSQDKAALGNLTKNRAYFPKHKNIIGPLDVMRSQIEAITQGNPPPAKNKPFETKMDL